MKLNLNNLDLDNIDDETIKSTRKRKSGGQQKIKDPRNKGKGRKPKKFRDYNKNNNR